MARKAKVKRKTTETDISVEIDLDGSGRVDIKTPIPFLSHMLTNLARHGLFDLKVKASGDVDVDFHHTVEDVGLSLGEALKKALGGKSGIRRCASATVPMMDSLSSVVLDLSGRPYLKINTTDESRSLTKRVFSSTDKGEVMETFDIDLAVEFLKALSNSAGIDLHVTLYYGRDIHHSLESIFKALGRALSSAVEKDGRIKGVMSTKGKL
ncbi:MAG: imidazoleglycerol-phosphate dehydratase HisB [Thermodesulfobacteriota bacterium]